MKRAGKPKSLHLTMLFLSFLCASLILTSCGPKIENFTPTQGSEGTEVTITGSRFGETAADNEVKFGGVTAVDVTVPQKDMIVATVPPGATTGLISVTKDAMTGYSDDNFIVTSQAKWSFMVFINGDNNLESAAITDFLEMSSVGSTAEVNIIAQIDRTSGYTNSYGDWTGTRRFLIQSGDDPSVTPLQDLGEQNMGDPAVLQDFVEWGISNYPAEHYALVIWNHGDGWRMMKEKMIENFKSATTRGEVDISCARAISSDDTDTDQLYMKEVQDALTAARTGLQDRYNIDVKLDIVGFDACLMGMIEVAYAIRNSTDYMVGSENLEPNNGWPYNTILDNLVENPASTPADLASDIVNQYGLSYPTDNSITQSALDLDHLDYLVSAINNFTVAASSDWTNLEDARNNSDAFHVSWYTGLWGTDLYDFAGQVYVKTSVTDIRTAADDLRTAVDNMVINEYHGSDWGDIMGVAIYFPPTLTDFNNDPDHDGYTDGNTFMPVEFVEDNQWDNWLQTYYSSI